MFVITTYTYHGVMVALTKLGSFHKKCLNMDTRRYTRIKRRKTDVFVAERKHIKCPHGGKLEPSFSLVFF